MSKNQSSPKRMLQHIQQTRAKKQSQLHKSHPLSSFTSVDLNTREFSVRVPIPGAVYTKTQCLNVIKKTTVKGTIERGNLIRFMAANEFVPSTTGLHTSEVLGKS